MLEFDLQFVEEVRLFSTATKTFWRSRWEKVLEQWPLTHRIQKRCEMGRTEFMSEQATEAARDSAPHSRRS
jgi:hypothetical protein